MAEGDPRWLNYNTDEDQFSSILRELGFEYGVDEGQAVQGEHETAPEGGPVQVQHNKNSWSKTVDTETSSTEPSATPTARSEPITEMPSESQGSTSSTSPDTVTWSRQDNGFLVCHLCSYSSKKPSNMVRHSRTHTGEHPFSCDLCPQSFAQRENLVYHRLSHTGERPYECTLCQATFKSFSNLNRHTRNHSEERP